MVLVMFAVSVLTFLIFNVIPNGDPAVRIAGRNSTNDRDPGDPRGVGLRRARVRPVLHHDEEGLHRRPDLVLQRSLNVGEEIRKGLPAHAGRWRSGPPCCGWSSRSVFGIFSALRAGRVHGPLPHHHRPDRHLDAGVLARRAGQLLPRASSGSSSPTAGTCRSPTTRFSGPTT